MKETKIKSRFKYKLRAKPSLKLLLKNKIQILSLHSHPKYFVLRQVVNNTDNIPFFN